MKKYKNINDTFDYDNIVFEDFSKIKELDLNDYDFGTRKFNKSYSNNKVEKFGKNSTTAENIEKQLKKYQLEQMLKLQKL